jgi:hypothetical protein
MATQFISAFIVIGLLVFFGILMTVGVINSKTRQVKVPSLTNQRGKNTERSDVT